MTLTTRGAEIPLGVECAWPFRIDSQRADSALRSRRLTEAWRRLLSVLRSPRRHGWAGQRQPGMSSLIGHAATGAAIAFACQGSAAPQVRRILPMLVLLAVAPDFDYFGFWLFGADLQPRATHSLVFCLGVSAIVWSLMISRRDCDPPPIGFIPLALAACSHLLLDLLVGVHSLPLLQPFAANEISSPVGLLPSAAHVSLTNYYLWRNLSIEMGVLLPALAVIVALCRGATVGSLVRKAVFMVPPWIACLVWSIGLRR